MRLCKNVDSHRFTQTIRPPTTQPAPSEANTHPGRVPPCEQLREELLVALRDLLKKDFDTHSRIMVPDFWHVTIRFELANISLFQYATGDLLRVGI